MEFLNPGLLALGGLVSVPIIIYLINRHRFQRRQWAAMEFLLRALRRSQKRIQLENLILLLVRITALVLLVLAIARPVVEQETSAASPGGPRRWIFVLDQSYSMGFEEGGRRLFDQCRETLVDLVENLLEPQDQAVLVTMGDEPQIVVGRMEGRKEFVDKLEYVELTSRGMRLASSLGLVEDVVSEFVDEAGGAVPCRVVLFSDLQRKDWLRGDAPASGEIAQVLGRLRERGVEFSIAELRASEGERASTPNVAVTGLEVKPRLVATEVPVEIRVTLRNFGSRAATGLSLSLLVDPDLSGEGMEAQLGEVVDVPAGSSATFSAPYSFAEPGDHAIVAELRSDGLVIDNRRFLVVRVHQRVDVLVVDGEPAVDFVDRETAFVELALEPTDDDLGSLGGRFTPFRVRYLGADQLKGVEWGDHSLVVLANVGEIRPEELESLERYVSSGGALIVFLGPNVRPSYYNEHLWKNGSGLLCWPLGEVRGGDAVPVFLEFADANHPVARYFAEHRERSYLYGPVVAFYRYFAVGAGSESRNGEGEDTGRTTAEGRVGGGDVTRSIPVNVLFRYTDLDRSPAVFDNPYGKGRVLWVTTTADQSWNEFAIWQDYVVFLHESVSYLLGFRQRTNNLLLGETFERTYGFPYDVSLHVPVDEAEEAGSETVLVQPTRPKDDNAFQFSYEETSRPGLYRLDLRRPRADNLERTEYFAVNIRTEESDLTPMTDRDFADQFDVEPSFFDVSERLDHVARHKALVAGRELAPWCLGLLVLLLLVETVLAHVFGRRTR